MSDSRVKCTFCGQVFMINREKAGASAPCPACGKDTFLDMPDDPTRLAAYQIKDSSGVTDDSCDCPACGAPVPTDAALCTQCGYNMETGKKKATKIVKQGVISRFAVPVLLMVIASMATYIVEEARFKRELENARAQPKEAFAQAGAVPTVAASSGELPLQEAGAPVVAVAEEPPTAEIQPSGSAAPTAEQQADALAQREQKLRTDLDQKSPLYQKDEQVTMVGKTGRVYRGKFFGVKEGVAVITVAGGFEEVVFDQLSHESRLRCDREFRENYIRQRVQPRR